MSSEHAMWLQRARAEVIRGIRRFGRPIVMTPPETRLGNILYFWLHAWTLRKRGGKGWVLSSPEIDEVLHWFPGARGLVVASDGLRRTDRWIEVPPLFFQQFGKDFSGEELNEFVREVLLTSAALGRGMDAHAALADADTVTIHVRRGDYFSDDRYRPRFAMDIDHYLPGAVRLARAQGPISRFVVVSDDPQWCAENLAWLTEGVASVEIAEGAGSATGVLEDFSRLCAAQRLILSNSSFGYWGAFVSGVAHGQAAAVIAPAFGVRGLNDAHAWQLDPRWQVVDNAAYERDRSVE